MELDALAKTVADLRVEERRLSLARDIGSCTNVSMGGYEVMTVVMGYYPMKNRRL
jgi:hypothetical protein